MQFISSWSLVFVSPTFFMKNMKNSSVYLIRGIWVNKYGMNSF
jgi:hypothetical protein